MNHALLGSGGEPRQQAARAYSATDKLRAMADDPAPFVWVFNAATRPFPGGVFARLDVAEAWIATHRLSGVLTRYPVDEGCFDWAVRVGLTGMKAETLERRRLDPAFIGGFSSASQDHVHYEDGRRR